MTIEQKVQVWIAVGTWVAGFATFFAAIVALYLAKRGEKVRLKVSVGVRLIVGGGEPVQKNVCFDITNIGERPVTISSIGWRVGKGKRRKHSIQPPSGIYSAQYPLELTYGKSAKFMVSLDERPNWVKEIAEKFIKDLSENTLKTLVGQVHTSVGHTIDVKPEDSLLQLFRDFREGVPF